MADTPIAFSHLCHRIKEPCNILFDLSAKGFGATTYPFVLEGWGRIHYLLASEPVRIHNFLCLPCVHPAFSKCFFISILGHCHRQYVSVCCLKIFTHSIAVHEKDTKWLSTLIFQTEKEGIMSIEVMGSLQEWKTQRQKGISRRKTWKRCGKLIEVWGAIWSSYHLTRFSIIDLLGWTTWEYMRTNVNMPLTHTCIHILHVKMLTLWGPFLTARNLLYSICLQCYYHLCQDPKRAEAMLKREVIQCRLQLCQRKSSSLQKQRRGDKVVSWQRKFVSALVSNHMYQESTTQ